VATAVVIVGLYIYELVPIRTSGLAMRCASREGYGMRGDRFWLRGDRTILSSQNNTQYFTFQWDISGTHPVDQSD